LSTGKHEGQPREGRNPLLNALRAHDLIRNKHIPHAFLTANRESRLQVLAGLLDTDGYLHAGTFEIATQYDQLATDILFLARSLGLAAYDSVRTKRNQSGYKREYHIITISGDLSVIPTRVARRQASAREQKKDVLVSGISVDAIGEGEYFGFSLDGDHLFLL